MATKTARRTAPRHANDGVMGNGRRIDQLGRVVIPADLRKMLGLRSGDLLEIRAEDGRILLSRAEPQCAICGTDEHLKAVHDKHVCTGCLRDLVST
jgi:AbrB family transcriptional regulator, transcriptional pleiotropic regulator of transition state genes